MHSPSPKLKGLSPPSLHSHRLRLFYCLWPPIPCFCLNFVFHSRSIDLHSSTDPNLAPTLQNLHFQSKFRELYLLLTSTIYWVFALYQTLVKTPMHIVSFDSFNKPLKSIQSCYLPQNEGGEHREVTARSAWEKNNIKPCGSVGPWSSVSHWLSLYPL